MRQTGWIILLIVTCVLAAFGRLAVHEFTGWDDPHTISQNPHFNPPRLDRLWWYWTAIGKDSPAGLYIPVTYTFWGLLAPLAYLNTPDEMGIRLNPYVYHGANVILHTLAVVVVFMILRMLLRHDWAACAGALLWVLHPVQVEPVGWASGTKDLLCGLLSFIAIWQYLQFARNPRGVWRYFLAMVCFVAAMLSKPTAMIVPVIVVILDVFSLGRPWRLALPSSAAWFILAVPCMVWTKLSQSTIGVPTVPLWARPLIATDSLAFYLYKLVFPLNLGVDYGHRPPQMVEEGRIWFTWIVPVTSAIILILMRRKAPMLLAAGGVFVAGLLPVLGFVPFQYQYYSTVADHYLYIPMLGPALALGWVLSKYSTRVLNFASAAALVTLGILSFNQGRHWKDDVTIFSKAVEVNPRSFLGHNNLGYGLFPRDKLLAEAQYRKAIAIKPDYASAHDNLARVLLQIDRPGAIEEAEQHIQEFLRIKDQMPPAIRPNHDVTHVVFGAYLMLQKRYEEAAHHFRSALQINPRNADAQRNLEAALKLLEESSTQPATQPTTATHG